ncbi:MAG: glycosyltransferase 61 family protein [Janthinobacterium lividum]
MNGKKIEFLYRGRVSPLTHIRFATRERVGSFNGGAYYRSNEVCDVGLQIKPSYKNEPTLLDTKGLLEARGNYVFGGMLQNEHFGHFIGESLCRVWAFSQLDPSFNSLVFYRRNISLPVAGFVKQVLSIVSPGVSLYIVDAPTQFDMLAVPEQITDVGSGFVHGHVLMHGFQKKMQAIGEGGAKRVFVSRSKLSRREGGFFGDRLLDHYLEAEGYHVIYPERMTIEEQLAAYNGADQLIFSEGSSLHLYALAAKPAQEVFVIWRRMRHTMFDWQVQSFGAKPLMGKPWIEQLWVPENEIPDAVHGLSVLNFKLLSNELHEAGFITAPGWDGPTEEAINEELEVISVKTNRKFRNVGRRMVD